MRAATGAFLCGHRTNLLFSGVLKPSGAAITNLLDACISGKTFCFIHLVC